MSKSDARELFEHWGGGETVEGELTIGVEDFEEFASHLLAEHTGRVKERLFKQGISRQRTEKLVEALAMVRNTVGDLKRGFAPSVEPKRWVEQVQAVIDGALKE